MYLVIDYLTNLGIAVHLVLTPLFFWLDYTVLAIFNIFASLAWITGKLANRNGKHATATILLFSETVLHTIIAVYYLGWGSGFQYYLVAGVPFSLFLPKLRPQTMFTLSALLCVLFIFLFTITNGKTYAFKYPDLLSIMNYANIVIAFSALSINSYYFRLASILSEKTMERLANADQLTGLLNRRGMRSKLEAQRDINSRNGSPFMLVLTDIDFFKKFNDTYGHDCGDFVLRGVAQLMKKRLRQYDVVARWGGEEFLILLPDTETDSALLVAEELRAAIENEKFKFAGNVLSVTMTFGVAQYHDGEHIDACLKRADEALYRGKESGRNKVSL